MTFIRSDILPKLEDASKQKRRLPQLESKFEVTQILAEVVSIESGGLPEQVRTVSRRTENLSPWPMFGERLEAGRWSSFHQMAVTSRQAVGATTSAFFKK